MVNSVRLLSTLTLENLKHMAKIEGIEVAKKASAKDVAKDLVALADLKSLKMLTGQMTKQDLEAVCEGLDIDFGPDYEPTTFTNKKGKKEEKKAPKPSKVTYQKRLYEFIDKITIEEFLRKKASDDAIELIANYLRIDVPKKALEDKDSKKDIIVKVVDEVHLSGIEALFYLFDVPFLKKCASDLDLKGATDSKKKLVEAIITKTDIKKLPKSDNNIAERMKENEEAAEEAADGEKKKIKKGITYQEIYQKYGVEELHDWCRDNGLIVAGKKKDVTNRILAFLDGDKETTMPQPGRGRSKSPHRKPKKDAKKKDTKEKKEDESEDEEDTKEKSKSPKKGTKDAKKKDDKKKSTKKEEDAEEDEEEEADEKSKKKDTKSTRRTKRREENPKAKSLMMKLKKRKVTRRARKTPKPSLTPSLKKHLQTRK
jgi:hypothetical protein